MTKVKWPDYPHNMDKLFTDFENGCRVFGVYPYTANNEDNQEILRHCAWCFADFMQMPCENGTWNFESYIRGMVDANERDFVTAGKDLVWACNRILDLILKICEDMELRMAFIRFMHESGFDQYNRFEL